MNLNSCRWTNASAIQKSIRRNHPDHALRAAYNLLAMAPEYLIRRLGVITVEDCGPANLPLLHDYLAHVPELMRDPHQVIPWVEAICASPKSRLLCDLSFTRSVHPAVQRLGIELGWLPPEALWQKLEEVGDLLTRFATMMQHPYRDIMVWVEGQEGGKELAATIRRARRLGTENMEMGLPLVWREKPTAVLAHAFPEPELIVGFPAYTFDQHTRIGLRAYRKFLTHLPEINLPARDKLWVVGEIVFALESGLLSPETLFVVHEELKPKVWEAFTPLGYGPHDMKLWTGLVQQRLPLLMECRRQQVSNYR